MRTVPANQCEQCGQLFGLHWTECPLYHRARLMDMTKDQLADRVAELEEENARLRVALKPLAEATRWQLDCNCKTVDVWEVDESDVNKAKEVLSS